MIKHTYHTDYPISQAENGGSLHDGNVQEYNRGWYIPVSIVRLYHENIINAQELVLLGIINSLQHPQKGCWASNAYLAEKWGGSHSMTVSKTIARLKGLGLLRVDYLDGKKNDRRIHVTYQPDMGPKNLPKGLSPRGGGLSRAAYPGLSREAPQVHSSRCTPTMCKKKVGGAGAPPSIEGGFVFSASTFPNSPAGKLCSHFEEFVKRHHLDWAISNQGRRIRVRPNRHNWLQACESLLESESYFNVEEVFEWYKEHHQGTWVPKCASMISFCQNYDKLKRAMFRDQKRNGEESGETEKLVAAAERLARPFRKH